MSKKRKSATGKKDDENTSVFRHLIKTVAATIILIVFVIMVGLIIIALLPVQEPEGEVNAIKGKQGRDGFVFEIYPKEKKTLLPWPNSSAISSFEKRTGRQPRIAIIIDDVGYDKKIAGQMISLDSSLTMSILPDSPFNKEIAAAAHKAGNETMLHLPMEPMEYPTVDPGPGVLLTSMPPDMLLRQLAENISEIPYVKGVNNHMGSKLTTRSTQLYQIFSMLKKRGLFFVDSRTTEKTLCEPSAKKLKIPFAKRDVFLDNSLAEADIEHQLNLLTHIADRRGKAIGIAHPHPETYRVFKQHLPSIKKNAQLVPVSTLAESPH